jgi:hypothetical protein
MRRHKLNTICIALLVALIVASALALAMLKTEGLVGH